MNKAFSGCVSQSKKNHEPYTLAILAAFRDSPTLNEAVAQSFRALALLKSDEPLAPDRLFRIADELDP
jgi:hypothetical protein